jgi:hypothetical protein
MADSKTAATRTASGVRISLSAGLLADKTEREFAARDGDARLFGP